MAPDATGQVASGFPDQKEMHHPFPSSMWGRTLHGKLSTVIGGRSMNLQGEFAMSAKSLILIVTAVTMAGCSTVEAGPAPSDTPEAAAAVVESFYTEYLGYIGMNRETGDFRNPLVDRAYRDMTGLSPAYVQKLDAMMEEGIMADPILCAQDIPAFVNVVGVEQEGDLAVAAMEDSFTGHRFEVELKAEDGGWLISSVRCGY